MSIPTPINDILDFGQALAAITKSSVDLFVKEDAGALDRQAAVYGYLGVVGTLGEAVFDELNKPGIASFARNLGGGAALAGLGVSVQQYREAKAAWNADASTANERASLGVKSFIASLGVKSFIIRCYIKQDS